jgi:hypothetical protein
VNEAGSVPRTSHALAVDGRVYVVDPAEGDGVDERIHTLGEPAAVIVLLDRHRRDADAFAERLGVDIHETPFGGVPGLPFEFRPVVRRRFWKEVALWWPEGRVLVAADALGTLGYMRTSAEPLGVHPMLRLSPPRQALAGLEPEHVLVGHGPGVHGAAASEALAGALTTARRRIPLLAADGVRKLVRGRR